MLIVLSKHLGILKNWVVMSCDRETDTASLVLILLKNIYLNFWIFLQGWGFSQINKQVSLLHGIIVCGFWSHSEAIFGTSYKIIWILSTNISFK